MKNRISIVWAIALAGVLGTSGAETPKISPLQQTLAASPAAEMPAKAADLVKSTRSGDRGFVTVDVVRAALTVNSAAAPAVVGAISRAVPDVASLAAGTAAEMLPKQAADIAKAAASAAPSKAAKIVTAVCRAAPKQYREVALAASQAAPTSSKEILLAVATVFPEMKSGIDHALLGYSGNPTTVALALDTIQPSQPNSYTPIVPAGPGLGVLAGAE